MNILMLTMFNLIITITVIHYQRYNYYNNINFNLFLNICLNVAFIRLLL